MLFLSAWFRLSSISDQWVMRLLSDDLVWTCSSVFGWTLWPLFSPKVTNALDLCFSAPQKRSRTFSRDWSSTTSWRTSSSTRRTASHSGDTTSGRTTLNSVRSRKANNWPWVQLAVFYTVAIGRVAKGIKSFKDFMVHSLHRLILQSHLAFTPW